MILLLINNTLEIRACCYVLAQDLPGLSNLYKVFNLRMI